MSYLIIAKETAADYTNNASKRYCFAFLFTTSRARARNGKTCTAQGETNMASMELIAAKAGVSRGTVDRVLHNRGQVKPETAEKVRAVMAELDFQHRKLCA